MFKVSIRPNIISVTLLLVLLAGCASLPGSKKIVDADLSPTPPSPDTAARIEQHDDEIAYEPGFQQFIATHVFRLSMPEINEPMGKDLCRQMIAELAH